MIQDATTAQQEHVNSRLSQNEDGLRNHFAQFKNTDIILKTLKSHMNDLKAQVLDFKTDCKEDINKNFQSYQLKFEDLIELYHKESLEIKEFMRKDFSFFHQLKELDVKITSME
jgi:hypothetical protein